MFTEVQSKYVLCILHKMNGNFTHSYITLQKYSFFFHPVFISTNDFVMTIKIVVFRDYQQQHPRA